MANKDTTVYLNSFEHHGVLTVHVKVTRQFRLRIWLCLKLIALACWIVKMGLTIEDDA